MTGLIRRLRFALSALWGPWAAIPVLTITIMGFRLSGSPFLGEGMWTIDWFANYMFATGSIVALAAAVDTARAVKPGAVHLLTGSSRPWLLQLRIAMWSAVPSMLVHLLVVLTGLFIGSVTEPSVPWLVICIGLGVQLSSFIWYAAVGAVIGVYVPPLLAGVIAGGGSFAAIFFLGQATSHRSFRLLDFGGATISRIGWTYDLDYVLGQGGILLVSAMFLLTAPWRVVEGRRQPRMLGVAFIAVAVAVMALVPNVLPARRNVATEVRPTYCLGVNPQVCFYPEHRQLADNTYPVFEKLFQAAQQRGYRAFVPGGHVLESNRTWKPENDERTRGFAFYPDAYESATKVASATNIVTELVPGEGCPQLRGAEPPKEIFRYKENSLRATWLSFIDDPSLTEMLPDTYELLTADQVKVMMEQFLRCDLYAPIPPR